MKYSSERFLGYGNEVSSDWWMSAEWAPPQHHRHDYYIVQYSNLNLTNFADITSDQNDSILLQWNPSFKTTSTFSDEPLFSPDRTAEVTIAKSNNIDTFEFPYVFMTKRFGGSGNLCLPHTVKFSP